MEINFYTLLYIEKTEQRRLAGGEWGHDERLKVFLKNAATLSASLYVDNIQGSSGVTILTNDSKTLERLCVDCNCTNLKYEQIEFSLEVPIGIPYYSAHFKIDAFRYLGLRPSTEYSVLLDNDVVGLRPFPRIFNEIANQGIPMCYTLDIKDCDRTQEDAAKILSKTPIIEWLGGEYISGNGQFFAKLYEECQFVAPLYFKAIHQNLRHIGDEMITSLAMAILKENNLYYVDAGSLGIIYRYSGYHDKESIQKYNPVLAHIPVDKVWVASHNFYMNFCPKKFLSKYKRHLRLYRLLDKISRPFRNRK